MRNLVLLFLLALSYHSSQSLPPKSCKRKENVLNCTGMGLTDCPTVKKQITNLILDNNLINNFTTIQCQKLSHLKYLTIRNNQLKEIQLNNFNELVKIDLSNNSLVNINLKCPSLTILIANSNKLLEIDFSIFNKQNLSIDLSNNKITKFTTDKIINDIKLNLSNNQLTKINGERMNNFVNLKSIDLSNNPLSCFCNESKSFIQWIMKHKSLIVNSGNTWCTTPIKQSIFNVICPQFSIKTTSAITRQTTKIMTSRTTEISNPTVSTPMKSTYTTHTSLTSSTKKSKDKIPAWKIVLAVIVPLMIIIAIIACYCLFCRNNNKYQRLDR